MNANELRELTNEELRQQLQERQGALMNFRMQVPLGTVDNVRAARQARREVARIKTLLHERELAATKEAN